MRTDKEIFQCSCCGNIHNVDSKYKPRGDNIYVTLWCEKCKDYTKQLYCGNNINDLYELYNTNIDPRMY